MINKYLGDIIVKEISNNKWILNTEIIYLKSSYNSFESKSEAEKIDFYTSKHSKSSGEINQVINDCRLLNLNKQFLSKMYNYSISKSKRRLFTNLKSFEFIYENKIMEKIWWNETEERWEEDVYSFWDNCNDYEYLKFIERREENRSNNIVLQ